MVEPTYLDPSAFTASILRDEGAETVDGLLASLSGSVLISDFGWGEFAAAVARRVRIRALRDKPARTLFTASRSRLSSFLFVELIPADIQLATDMIGDFDLALELPDAVHVAIMRRLGAVLLSTDRQQVTAARALGLSCINPLEET